MAVNSAILKYISDTRAFNTRTFNNIECKRTHEYSMIARIHGTILLSVMTFWGMDSYSIMHKTLLHGIVYLSPCTNQLQLQLQLQLPPTSYIYTQHLLFIQPQSNQFWRRSTNSLVHKMPYVHARIFPNPNNQSFSFF